MTYRDPTAGLCPFCGHPLAYLNHDACTPEGEAAMETDHGDPGADVPERGPDMAPWTCKVDGCDRSALREDHGVGGMCSPHYAAWRKHSPDRPKCSTEDCDKPSTSRGLCHKHYAAFWRKTRSEGTFSPADSRDRWDQDIGYVAAHQRVRVRRGSAKTHQCISCGDPAQEWAYQHNDPDELSTPEGYPYSGRPECYEPMCLECHAILDGRKTVTHCPSGHPWAEFARYRTTNGTRWCLGCSRDREERLKKRRASA